jgi:DNA-directed RNA polymerase subunit M/transcription elongation factor TFIIS|tara:strand:+ start:744 stop:1238 length:495 start_codon:yes stop_codon:yes gene_type:complete
MSTRKTNSKHKRGKEGDASRKIAAALFRTDIGLSKAESEELETRIWSQSETPIHYTQTVRKLVNNLTKSETNKHPDITTLLSRTDTEWLKVSNERIWTDLNKRNEEITANYEQLLLYSSSEKTLLQCGRCKKFTVSYYQRQTRSADEPMTCFAKCHTCDRSWKQ